MSPYLLTWGWFRTGCHHTMDPSISVYKPLKQWDPERWRLGGLIWCTVTPKWVVVKWCILYIYMQCSTAEFTEQGDCWSLAVISYKIIVLLHIFCRWCQFLVVVILDSWLLHVLHHLMERISEIWRFTLLESCTLFKVKLCVFCSKNAAILQLPLLMHFKPTPRSLASD